MAHDVADQYAIAILAHLHDLEEITSESGYRNVARPEADVAVIPARRCGESLTGERLLDDVSPPPASEFAGAEGDIVCWISAMGHAHDCRGPRSAPAGWFIERLRGARFAPAIFEGEPFETEYVVRFSFRRY